MILEPRYIYCCFLCSRCFLVRPKGRFELRNKELAYAYLPAEPHPCPQCGTLTLPQKGVTAEVRAEYRN